MDCTPHFVAASAMTRKNILLYHVPSRTGSAITIRLFERLVMKCHNITGMKYAAQDYMTLAKLKKLFPSLYFYSGDDVTCFDAIAAGADGVISVMSHMLLPEMKTAILTKNQAMQHELEFFAKYYFSRNFALSNQIYAVASTLMQQHPASAFMYYYKRYAAHT